MSFEILSVKKIPYGLKRVFQGFTLKCENYQMPILWMKWKHSKKIAGSKTSNADPLALNSLCLVENILHVAVFIMKFQKLAFAKM